MISAPVAHVGGIPIEETLASLGPALLVAFGVAWANLRARLRRVRSRATARAPDGSAAAGPYAQARRALEIIGTALIEAGGTARFRWQAERVADRAALAPDHMRKSLD